MCTQKRFGKKNYTKLIIFFYYTTLEGGIQLLSHPQGTHRDYLNSTMNITWS